MVDLIALKRPRKKNIPSPFKPEYTTEFACLVSGKGSSLARCNICDNEFRIDHAGHGNIRKHVNFKKLSEQSSGK